MLWLQHDIYEILLFMQINSDKLCYCKYYKCNIQYYEFSVRINYNYFYKSIAYFGP